MIKILPPIKESTEDYEAVEEEIKRLFKLEIYFPLLKEFYMSRATLRNSLQDLASALNDGKITFSRGVFSGKFSANVSKELKKLGATFDRKTSSYRILQADLPYEIRHAISSSEIRFTEKLSRIDEKLAAVTPESLAEKLNVSKHFDRALWKVNKDFNSSVEGIAIPVNLSPEQRKRIAAEWSKNMQLWIKDFAEKEILDLRANMQKTVFSGNRFASAVKTIQESYGVTANKAKFLARQETSLLMTKFKQTRYQEAGVNYYIWGCVTGTSKHPVRPLHKKNEGKIFRWDSPPVVDEQGNRKNPGQDYNCRCFARPVVGHQEK